MNSNGVGHLVYVNNGTLFAVPLDVDALEVRESPVRLLEQVAYSAPNGAAQIDFSQTGVLLYRSGVAVGSGLVTVQWLDSDGKTQPLLAKPGRYERPRLAPEGRRLALEILDGSKRDVWIYEWERKTMTRLTFDAGEVAMVPVWSPDGQYIVFSEQGGIFWTRSDGAGKRHALTESKSQQYQYPFSFTPDGKRLAWMESKATGGIAVLSRNSTGRL